MGGIVEVVTQRGIAQGQLSRGQKPEDNFPAGIPWGQWSGEVVVHGGIIWG